MRVKGFQHLRMAYRTFHHQPTIVAPPNPRTNISGTFLARHTDTPTIVAPSKSHSHVSTVTLVRGTMIQKNPDTPHNVSGFSTLTSGHPLPWPVGIAGFEPATPRSRSECAAKLRHTPLRCPADVLPCHTARKSVRRRCRQANNSSCTTSTAAKARPWTSRDSGI